MGRMPFMRRLMLEEGYEALPYRCGLPSTTPFCQAGILYGDNAEIPSYRWWDKKSQRLVAFGEGGTFPEVADRYFQGRHSLTKDGICIAALYDAAPVVEFGPVYQERHLPPGQAARLDRHVIVPFLTNPATLYYWLRHGFGSLFRIGWHYLRARLAGRPAADTYVLADLFHETVVHHLTRFAIRQAMREGRSVIYAGVYTYDEAAHAFGPEDPWTERILRHVDHTVRLVAGERKGEYELVVLSDHGQVESVPFVETDGRRLGEMIAGWLPSHAVEEHRGGRWGEPEVGHVELAYSGGLAHLYFRDLPGRVDADEVEKRHAGFIDRLAALDRIDFVMTRAGGRDVIFTGGRRLEIGQPEAAEFLARLDEPAVIAAQLRRLNSFAASGDLVVFGRYRDGVQVNFEDQAGGHGSAGGDQLHPFLLVKKEWGIDTAAVVDASGLYPILVRLRDEGRAGAPPAPPGWP